MKFRLFNFSRASTRKRELHLAQFGSGRLVKIAEGRVQLRGGDADDLTSAKEYISLFMHEALLQRR